MSNTQTTKKTGDAASNGKTQARASTEAEVASTKNDDKKTAQQAQVAEAEGQARSLEFEGFTYELLDGQPSPKALTYVARWQIDDENMALILSLREMLGEGQWDLWCARHDSTVIMDFWVRLNRLAGGGEGN